MEVAYRAGTESPEHVHAQDSYIYLLRGHLHTTLEGRAADLYAGEALLQPAGTPHTVTAVIDSDWLEFKAPPMTPWW
jgi:quercetin dioxygenase-like cupin family protein